MDEKAMREAFYADGWGQNDVMWKCWQQACAWQVAALSQKAEAPGATVRDQMQDWAGMDGATAHHLIERHADNWADVAKMMGEWLAANSAAPKATPKAQSPDSADVTILAQMVIP